MKPEQPSSRPEAVKVRTIKFVAPTDIPGAPLPSGITAKDVSNETHYEIEWQPWTRHHRIVWFEAGKKDPSRILMIHESRIAIWEPA